MTNITLYQRNPNLKAAGVQIQYTEEQIKEYIKCSTDPVYFIENYAKIVSLDEGIVNFVLYEYQKRLIDTIHDSRNILGVWGRQQGKSTVVAGYVSWYVLFNEHKTAVILANKQIIAKEIFAKVQLIIENLPIWLQQGIEEWNKTSLTLENGSRCLCAATSPSAVRGMSCVTGDTKICLVDEYNNIYYDTIHNFLSWKHCVNYYGHEYFVNVHDIENLTPIGKKFIQLSSTSCMILSEKGFRTFTGIIKHPICDILLLTTNKSSLKCTGDHRVLLPDGSYIAVEELKVGDKLYNNHIVTSITHEIPSKVYDILDVEETNSYFTNGIVSHNCNLLVLDEFAHLKSNLADEFIASVFPTLSSSEQSKLVIISTPYGLNHYHKLWMDAKNGLNDFVTVEAHWSEHPKRTLEWAEKERKKLGEIRYQTEIECIWEYAYVTVMNTNTNVAEYISIGNLYTFLHTPVDFRLNIKYKILTDYGWNSFSGINKTFHEETYTIYLSCGKKIVASPNHLMKTNNSFKKVKDLTINDNLNKLRILNIEKSGAYNLYDFVNVDNEESSYIADNITHHNCVFAGSSYTLINGIKLSELPTLIPQFANDNLEIYFVPEKEHHYVISVDTSRGRHHDYSALSIIDITNMPYNVVGIYKDNTISVLEFPHLIYNLAKQYNDAFILIETNDLGESVSNTIWYEYEYDNIYFTSKQKLSDSVGFPGVRTTSSVKSLGCSVLKDLVEQNQLLLNSHKIIEELGMFVKKGKSYGAEDITINDDLTTTLWLFAWLTKQDIFADIVNVNIRELLSANKQKYIDENMTPYGFYNNGITERIEEIGEKNRELPTGDESYYLTEDQLELLNF